MQAIDKPLLAAIASVTSAGLAISNPLWVSLPSVVVAAVAGTYAAEQLKDKKLKELMAGASFLSFELLGIAPAKTEQVAPLAIAQPKSVAEFLQGYKTAENDPTTADFWTHKRAKKSAILVGPRGSGKSKLFAYRLQQATASGARTTICDIHYFAEDDEATVWLPGVADDVFQEKYLVTTPEQTLEALLAHEEAVKRRVNGQESNNIALNLFIDEWRGVYRRWSEIEQRRAIKALYYIVDEGRKAKVNVSLSLHSLKKEETGIDSSIVQGCDLYIMGTALEDRANQFPTALDRKIAEQRNETAARVGVPQRVLVFRDYNSGAAQVVVSPDLRAAIAFAVEESNELTPEAWIAENQDEIDELMASGKRSARQLSEHFNIPRLNSNALYVAIKRYVEISARMNA